MLYTAVFGYSMVVNARSNESILNQMQQELSGLIKIAEPSVVTISSKTSFSYPVNKVNKIFSLFSSEEEKTVSYKMICTGLIYDANGYIITKSKELKDNEEITVTLYDGRTYEPEFIGFDPQTDIMALKIDSQDLTVPKFKRGEKIQTGEWIAVIGNSMGCPASLSLGLMNRFVKGDMFQFSAMVSPGNSGSPIFDIEGNVVGILMAQLESRHGFRGGKIQSIFSNVGLALSIDKVDQVMQDLIAIHEDDSGWLGVLFKSDSLNGNRVVIEEVIPNTPAHISGLMENDLVITYNNNSVESKEELVELIKATKPGSVIPINIIRQNNRLNVFVEIGNMSQYISSEKQRPWPKTGHKPPPASRMENDVKSHFRDEDVDMLNDRLQHLEREIKRIKTRLNNQQK